jgi:hypothetical protein
MDFEISPKLLLETLKRLMPHKGKLIKKGPLVTLHASESALDLVGQFDNAWSIPAMVHRAGACTVDIVAFTGPLKLYDPKKGTALRAVR